MVNLSRLLSYLSRYYNAVLQPQMQASGLPSSKFARRYYRNLYLISLPLATEMFHFARFAPRRVTNITASWVSPFGHLRIKAS
jgi:hypothetical protein